MSFSVKEWKNLPAFTPLVGTSVTALREELNTLFNRSTETPLSGEALEDLERRLAAFAEAQALGAGGTYVPPSGGDDTAAIKATLEAHSSVRLGEGAYTVSGSLGALAEYARLIGAGRKLTTITFTGTGTMLTLGSESTLAELTIEGTASKYTLLAYKGTFRNHCRNVTLRGTNKSGAIHAEQVGVDYTANAGDSVADKVNFQNLGQAVIADSQQNYLIGCQFATNHEDIVANAGSYADGMIVIGSTFTSEAAVTASHVNLSVNCNLFAFLGCWFEGCENDLILGSATEGPDQVVLRDCFLAATTKCLWVKKGCGFVRLDNVRFGKDGAATPKELTIENEEGKADGLLSGQEFDFAPEDFPGKWQYGGSRGTQIISGRVFGPEKWESPQHIKTSSTTTPGLVVETPTAMGTYLFEVKETGESPSFYVDQNSTMHAAGLISGAAGIKVSAGLGVWGREPRSSQYPKIASPAETLAELKTAVDHLRQALYETGITTE